MPLSGMTCTARMLMPSTSSFALVATRNLISTRTSRSGTITWSASPADKVVDVHGKVIRGAVRVLGKLDSTSYHKEMFYNSITQIPAATETKGGSSTTGRH